VVAGHTGGWWADSLGLALAVLHDRTVRRRVMMRFVVLLLGVFALGLWVVDDWLLASPWRFVMWWGGCGLLAVFVFLFALYDVLAVVREERERFSARLREDRAPGDSRDRRDSTCEDDP
jgi:hypothetical protein